MRHLVTAKALLKKKRYQSAYFFVQSTLELAGPQGCARQFWVEVPLNDAVR